MGNPRVARKVPVYSASGTAKEVARRSLGLRRGVKVLGDTKYKVTIPQTVQEPQQGAENQGWGCPRHRHQKPALAREAQ